MTEEEGPRTVIPEKWCKSWEENRTMWHRPYNHPLLVNHLEELTCGREDLKILLPFCGKSLDMLWLAKLGHKVTGIDVSPLAVKQFAEESNITFTQEALPSGIGTKHTATNASITFYVCDVFDFEREELINNYDAIWDKGGFSVVNVEQRCRYVNLLHSLLAPGGVYFLCVLNYEQGIIRGPPHRIDEKNIKDLFGDYFEISYMDRNNALGELQRSWGLETFDEVLYKLTHALTQAD